MTLLASPCSAAAGSGLIRSSSASTRPSLDDGVGTRSMFPASTGSLAEGTFRAEGCFDWVINRSDLVRSSPGAHDHISISAALVGVGSGRCKHAGRPDIRRQSSMLAALL